MKVMFSRLYSDLINAFENGMFDRLIGGVKAQSQNNINEEASLGRIGYAFSNEQMQKFDDIAKSISKRVNPGYHLNNLFIRREVERRYVEVNAIINKSDMSKYLNSKTKPPFNRLIRIALALKLTLEETQELLKVFNYSFAETLKDDLLIVCIDEGVFDVYGVEAILRSYTKGKGSIFDTKELRRIDVIDGDFEIEITKNVS